MESGDRLRSRLLAAAPWVASALLVCLKLPWLFSADPITGWDTVGHLHLARVYRELFSGLRSTGYDAGWFQGQPAFVLYPPFFYFLVALLDVVLGHFYPLAASFNLAVLLVVLFYCAAYLSLARRLLADTTDPLPRGLLSLAGLLIPLTYAGDGLQGAGLVGVLGGTFVSTLGLALALMALSSLEQYRRTRAVPALVRCFCLAGLLYYTHYLSAVFALLLLAVYLVAFRRELRGRLAALLVLGPAALGAPIIYLYAGHKAFSSATAQATYYPPLLSLLGKDFYAAWRASPSLGTIADQLFAHLKIAQAVSVGLFVAGLMLVFGGRLKTHQARFVCGAALLLFWLAADTSAALFFPGVSVHWYRSFDLFLTFSSLVAVMAAAWFARKPAARMLPATLLALLVLRLLVWDPVAHEQYATMNLTRSLQADGDAVRLSAYLRSLPPGRVVLPEVLRARGRHGSPHWLDVLIQDAHHRNALGLTIESSLTPLLTYAYLSRGMGHVFVWGIDATWAEAIFAAEPVGAPERFEALPDYLDAAGVGYVIAQSPIARGYAESLPGRFERTFESGPLAVYRVAGALAPVTALVAKPWGFVELDALMGKRLPAGRVRRDFLLHANWVRLNSSQPPASIVNLGPDPRLVERLRGQLGGLVIVNTAGEPAAHHSLPPSIRSGLPLILVNFRPVTPAPAGVEVLEAPARRELVTPGRLPRRGRAAPVADRFGSAARAPMAWSDLGSEAVAGGLGAAQGSDSGETTVAVEVRLSYSPDWSAANGSPVLQTDLNHMLVLVDREASPTVSLAYRAPVARLVTMMMALLAAAAAASGAVGALTERLRARGASRAASIS